MTTHHTQRGGAECEECVAGSSHCHGTLIIHADGSRECVDADCREVQEERHELVINCRTGLGDCHCGG
jgi:hypothetical protein